MFKFNHVLMNEEIGDAGGQGGSLLGSVDSSAAASADTGVVGDTLAPVTPNVDQAPAIERPEWVLDKYATEGRDMNEAISEQAKAYVELQKQFGGFTGAPEEYEFSLPEGVEGEIDTELPLFGQFQEWAKKNNASNESANELFGLFVGYQNAMEESAATDFNAEKEKLGDQADQRINQVVQWAGANLEPADMATLETMTMNAEQIGLVEKLIGKTRNTQTIKTHQDVSPVVSGFTEADFREAVASEKFQNDPKYRAEIRKKGALLYPGS